MTLASDINAASIVLIGYFNPLIFRPEWFSKKELLTESEVNDVEINVIHPEMVAFGVKPWLRVSVEHSRFSASVFCDPLVKLPDFVVGCFNYLPETPITKVGINREMHFDLKSEERWHKLGDLLAPKEPWGDFLSNGDRRKGGLASISMKQNNRDDNIPGHTAIKLTPSTAFKHGVYCQVNNHYDLTDDDSLSDARTAVALIKKQWDSSIVHSEELIQGLLAQL